MDGKGKNHSRSRGQTVPDRPDGQSRRTHCGGIVPMLRAGAVYRGSFACRRWRMDCAIRIRRTPPDSGRSNRQLEVNLTAPAACPALAETMEPAPRIARPNFERL